MKYVKVRVTHLVDIAERAGLTWEIKNYVLKLTGKRDIWTMTIKERPEHTENVTKPRRVKRPRRSSYARWTRQEKQALKERAKYYPNNTANSIASHEKKHFEGRTRASLYAQLVKMGLGK